MLQVQYHDLLNDRFNIEVGCWVLRGSVLAGLTDDCQRHKYVCQYVSPLSKPISLGQCKPSIRFMPLACGTPLWWCAWSNHYVYNYLMHYSSELSLLYLLLLQASLQEKKGPELMVKGCRIKCFPAFSYLLLTALEDNPLVFRDADCRGGSKVSEL